MRDAMRRVLYNVEPGCEVVDVVVATRLVSGACLVYKPRQVARML